MPISSLQWRARNSAWSSVMVILGLFMFIVMRGLLRLLAEPDPFVVLASSGLLTSFGLQAFINMASTLGI